MHRSLGSGRCRKDLSLSARDQTLHLLNPCPGCDASTHFPAMPSIENVIDGLLEQCDGNCPICGAQVVVATASTPSPAIPVPTLSSDSRIVDLPVSIRFRAALNRLGYQTLADALDVERNLLIDMLGSHADEFRTLVDKLQTQS